MPERNGGWLQTISGAIGAFVITSGALYTVVIVPQTARIEKLEAYRERDRDQLALLYSLKDTVGIQFDRDRANIGDLKTHLDRIEEEQKRRTSPVAIVPALISRIDRIEQRNDMGAPTLNEEVKTLRTELESLRQRLMVPLAHEAH